MISLRGDGVLQNVSMDGAGVAHDFFLGGGMGAFGWVMRKKIKIFRFFLKKK